MQVAESAVLNATWTTIGASAYAWVYLHQGGRFDPATGLYNFRNRDLSPAPGRWMRADPLMFRAGDPNIYRYVGNDPTNRVDKSGLITGSIGLGAGADIGIVHINGSIDFQFGFDPTANWAFSSDLTGSLGVQPALGWDANIGIGISLTTADKVSDLLGWSKVTGGDLDDVLGIGIVYFRGANYNGIGLSGGFGGGGGLYHGWEYTWSITTLLNEWFPPHKSLDNDCPYPNITNDFVMCGH